MKTGGEENALQRSGRFAQYNGTFDRLTFGEVAEWLVSQRLA